MAALAASRSRRRSSVVAEVVILFVGIIARAVFNRPIIWSDELASILFLWLAMLGSAIAVQRGTTCA